MNAVARIFTGFAIRDLGMTSSQAAEELARLQQCSTRDQYRRISRVGASFVVDRARRDSIWSSYENAQNHACFVDLVFGGAA